MESIKDVCRALGQWAEGPCEMVGPPWLTRTGDQLLPLLPYSPARTRSASPGVSWYDLFSSSVAVLFSEVAAYAELADNESSLPGGGVPG